MFLMRQYLRTRACAAAAPQVLSWPPFLHQSDPVLSALHGIFLQLAQQGGAAQRGGGAAAAGLQRGAVNTAALRDTLARLPGRSLRLGEWQHERRSEGAAGILHRHEG
jgi:hypothetical protein